MFSYMVCFLDLFPKARGISRYKHRKQVISCFPSLITGVVEGRAEHHS